VVDVSSISSASVSSVIRNEEPGDLKVGAP